MQQNIIDWLYKPTTLDKKLISVISKELEILYAYVYSLDSTKKDTVACKFDDVKTIRSFCACLDSELQRLKIDQLLDHVVFTTCDPRLPSMPIHRDYYDQQVVCFGLNIPVTNCQDSFIVWYDANLLTESKMPEYSLGTAGVGQAIPADQKNAKEIARMTCDQPYWINNYVPHNGMALHKKTRIMSSIRFTPEINSLVLSGYFDKFLVEQ